MLADAAQTEGRADATIGLCRNALALEPAYPNAYAGIAMAGFQQNRDHGQAATMLDRAIRLAGPHPRLLAMLNGMVSSGTLEIPALARTGRRVEARALTDSLLQISSPLDEGTARLVDQFLASQAPMERFVESLRAQIAQARPDLALNHHRIVILYGGIGDQIAVLGFLAHLHARDGIPFLVVGTPNNLGLAAMYRGPHIGATALMHDTINPWGFPLFMRFEAGHAFLPWIPLHFTSEQFAQEGGGNKVDFYRRVLGVGMDTPIAAPIPHPDSVARARERFAALGVPAGRTVILGPHANTIGSLPESWWIEAARCLRDAGFAVLVNGANNARSFDHHRNRASGTVAGIDGIEIHIPLDEMLPFTALAGHFLGVRSGLCDLLAFAAARLVILYPAERKDGDLSPAFGGPDGFESVRRCYRPADCVERTVAVDQPFSHEVLGGWL
ncbi:hypothetical protein SAMN02982994_1668 [Azospirillum lipoferum]|nr:hypothetical protein SAMN02982994_1668 [Azospirillum lipoferum]